MKREKAGENIYKFIGIILLYLQIMSLTKEYISHIEKIVQYEYW